MLSINWWQKLAKALIAFIVTGVLVLSLVSCGERAFSKTAQSSDRASQRSSGDISEVSVPEVIQQLRQVLDIYQPQVAILSPQPDQVLQDNTVTVRFQVQDLPLFKNSELNLGPHLHVILDNQPYIPVYDLNQPLVFSDLPPGTHTLRVFASRPWYESFKNEGAYAQTTFHIFTKTQDNNPDPALPLLTYSSPQGSYGAEPILLDFYLTNAPLHLVAQENPQDDIADWRIRCTINGNSFVLDRWQAVYLKGFKPGKNWVQLEFIDEQGNPVKNAFNNTVRLINYEPKGQEPHDLLVRGELSVSLARGIVDPNYSAKAESPVPAPTPSPTPSVVPTPTPSPTPSVEITPPGDRLPPSESVAPDVTAPELEKNPEPQPDVTPALESENKPAPQLNVTPEQETVKEVEPTPTTAPESKDSKQLERQKPGSFFRRYLRPTSTPTPGDRLPPTLPEIIDAPASDLVPSTAAPGAQSSVEPEEKVSSEK